MTCYFRHLNAIFDKAGVKVTKENRKTVDKIIRAIVKVDHGDCPVVWREVKKKLAENEGEFVSELAAAWKQSQM